jgi:hypothetical protein
MIIFSFCLEAFRYQKGEIIDGNNSVGPINDGIIFSDIT